MLFRCNLLALVGGGVKPRYPPNKVMIWDDHRGRTIGELSFRQPVLGVKLRRDRVAVALSDRVYLYNFSDLTLLDQIPTVSNPRGLLCLSPDTAGAGAVLACPSINKGGVRVELYACRKTLLLDAHESSLAALALSVDGMYLSTASEKGTVIRVFSTQDGNGQLVHELRRGVERAEITCLTFSLDKMWLGASSDRGTAHVFNLMPKEIQNGNGKGTSATGSSSSKSFSGWMKKVKKGEGSYAQIRGICDPTVCAFVPDRVHTLAVVGKGDGSILLADFSAGPGEAVRVGYHVFFKEKQEQGQQEDVDDGIIFGDDDEEDGFVNIQTGNEELGNNDDGEEDFVGIEPKKHDAIAAENDTAIRTRISDTNATSDATTTKGE